MLNDFQRRYVKQWWGQVDLAILALAVDAPPVEVHATAVEMGLAAHRTTRKRKRWDARDIEILKDYYPVMTDVQCARAMGRSVPSIRGRAHSMGLKKSEKWEAQVRRLRIEKRIRS